MPVGALQLAVARRLPVLDEPVLEYERAQLGVGGPVVHDLGALGPARGRAEVRPRARAQRHRLAHVERPAAVVAKHVHPRVVGEGREVGPLGGRDRRPAGSVLRARRRERSSSSAWPTVTAFAHRRGNSAQNTRAQVSASGSARCTSSTSIPRASASGASPRRRASGAKRRASCDRAEHRRARPVEAGALERLAEHAPVEARAVRHEHPPAQQLGHLRQHLAPAGARVHHRLRDPGEALDPARQRPLRRARASRTSRAARPPPTSTAPTSVSSQQLAAEAVGLGVERHELGAGHRLLEQLHRADAIYAARTDGPRRCRAKPSTRALSLAAWPAPPPSSPAPRCGHESPKWHGRCPGCGEWNTFVEERRRRRPARRRAGRSAPGAAAGAAGRGRGAGGRAHDAPASASSTACSAAASCPARWC